ncbi:MAG: hypothetical protein KBS75_04455 [Bacteroidales bacterium]|nr:hypothetical protein [Candidatus Equimonas faecalis]
MKKYKDLTVHTGSFEKSLLGIVAIGAKCQQHQYFKYSDEIEQMYQADDRMNHILVNLPSVPSAVMLVYASESDIKVLNIVPFNHSCDRIEKDVYNHIVDTFNEMIITPLFSKEYAIDCTKDDVSIQDIIPQSFPMLNRWTHCPGAPNSPFIHQFDLELWFDFLCALHTHGEELSSGDLEQWLSEDNGWDDETVTDAIIRYETERDLLNYYDSHYGRN